MDYKKIYNQIVIRAKQENRRKKQGIYYEAHHIIPKCMGGEGKFKDLSHPNIVLLTGKEHFLCHMLLCEIYPGNVKLYQALWLMSTNRNRKIEHKYKISAKTYERIKNEYINNAKGKTKFTEEHKQKLREGRLGKKMSEESKQKISEANKGNKYALGFKNNEEQCLRKSIANKGKKFTEETKFKISNSKKGKKHSQETCDKISKALKGKIRSEEYCKNHSEKMKNIEWSYETNNKRSKSMIGKNVKIVEQYDLEMNFIKEWPSMKEACIYLNKPRRQCDITSCCKGKQKTAFGYKWKYKS